jgi:hypothetical protein
MYQYIALVYSYMDFVYRYTGSKGRYTASVYRPLKPVYRYTKSMYAYTKMMYWYMKSVYRYLKPVDQYTRPAGSPPEYDYLVRHVQRTHDEKYSLTAGLSRAILYYMKTAKKQTEANMDTFTAANLNFVGIGKIYFENRGVDWNVPALHFMVDKTGSHYEATCLEFGLVSSGSGEREAAQRLAEQIQTYLDGVMSRGGRLDELADVVTNNFMEDYWGLYRAYEFRLAARAVI